MRRETVTTLCLNAGLDSYGDVSRARAIELCAGKVRWKHVNPSLCVCLSAIWSLVALNASCQCGAREEKRSQPFAISSSSRSRNSRPCDLKRHVHCLAVAARSKGFCLALVVGVL